MDDAHDADVSMEQRPGERIVTQERLDEDEEDMKFLMGDKSREHHNQLQDYLKQSKQKPRTKSKKKGSRVRSRNSKDRSRDRS